MDNYLSAIALTQAATLLLLAFVSYTNYRIGTDLMATQDAVDALTAQVDKIREEVTSARDALTTELDSVKEQLANAGVTEQVDLSGLTAAIQAVDDINPDNPPF